MQDQITKIEAMEDAYTSEAYRHSYHPVKDYLASLQWDGKNHIATLCNFIKDAHPPIRYNNGSTAVFGVGYPAGCWGPWLRYSPGARCAAKIRFWCWTVRGELGKSTFALWLGSGLPDMFIEEAIRPDDKGVPLAGLKMDLGST